MYKLSSAVKLGDVVVLSYVVKINSSQGDREKAKWHTHKKVLETTPEIEAIQM